MGFKVLYLLLKILFHLCTLEITKFADQVKASLIFQSINDIS